VVRKLKLIKMKRIFILITTIGFLSACTEYDFHEDQGIPVSELPGYIAFNGAGTTVNYTVDDIDECTTAGVEVEAEAPTGILSDATVTYSLSGTAVFGVDYTIAGATASGGSFVIEHKQSADPNDFQNLDNGSFVIVPLVDGVSEGDETVIVTLESATTAEGTLSVGRGGTDFLKSVTVNLVDVDFAITPTGTFDVQMTGDFGSIADVVVITETTPGVYLLSDFAGDIFGQDIDYTLNKNACGWGITAPVTGGSSFGTVSADISGSFDAAGVLTLDVVLQCCGAVGAEYTLVCIPQ
jgi:hypothetical protein